MASTVEVKYFNSFVIRKAVAGTGSTPSGNAVWTSMPWNDEFYPVFPLEASTNNDVINYDWFVEESRIRGEFNSNEVDLGVRSYVRRKDVGFKKSKNSLIFSGIFNSRTSENQSNVFSVGEDITKSLDPRYGAIEWMYAEDSNLTIFQEFRVGRALIDRDAIYSAEGGSITAAADRVVGDVQYYSGEYGIGKNPESFAVDGYRKYFADTSNGAVMRLSNDGMTEISDYGMSDFFRDEFKKLSSEYKRFAVDVEWTIPWNSNVSTLTVSGDNIDEIELGMAIEGIVGHATLYVINIGTPSGSSVVITLDRTIQVTQSPQPSVINLVKYVKDQVIGGIDNNYEDYVLSIVYNEPSKESSSPLVGIDVQQNNNPSP